MNHNQPGNTENYSHEGPIITGYADGTQSYLYDKPGQQNIGGFTLAIVRTYSGNSYGISRDLITNANTQETILRPKDTPKLAIGEEWHIPGFYITSPVKEVECDYWGQYANRTNLPNRVDRISPFVSLDSHFHRERQKLPQEQFVHSSDLYDLNPELQRSRSIRSRMNHRNSIAKQYADIPSWY